ncbi:receptor-like protein 7 [Corylus avellana]|uniref:receptor-like protein 7 n=1 Tax=Corylus avellana TaxID=13451 RepID=UPI00286A9B6F|nr:receptor-like protein 7 [Corylus avellana]
MNFTQLAGLDLSANKLHGQISNSVFKLKNLEFLDLSNNYLTCIVEFDEFVTLINLTTLDIFSNQLSEFSNFLRNQHELKYLNLSNNKIHGHFPEWMWNTSTTSLKFLDLSNNFLTVFGQHPIFPPWTRLQVLDLWFNLLQGSLPIPPVSTLHFYISNNSLNGNIPFSFCNLSSLQVLDLANNNLSGSLPRWLDNFRAFSISFQIVRGIEENYLRLAYAYSMMMKNKGKDLFYEKVQELFINIDFSNNRFVGEIPESIGNLKGAQLLNLSNNAFIGRIPSSLKILVEMESLDLSQNKFSGDILQQLT